MTKHFSEMTDAERNEVRKFGCTIDDMQEVVDHNSASGVSPTKLANRILTQCQEMLAHDDGGKFDIMLVEDVRQAINRAKWILLTQVEEVKA